MNKESFLLALYDALKGLPIEDVERSVGYYREMIDERVEDGMSEEDAVAALGGVEEIARQIMADVPLASLVREKVTGGRRLRVWEIVLLVLGSPVWLPLVLAAIIVLLAVYIVIWALVLVLYAVTVSFAAGAVACVGACVPMLLRGAPAQMLLTLGGGLVCGGLAIPLLFASNGAARGMARASKSIRLWVKSLFVRKEAGV